MKKLLLSSFLVVLVFVFTACAQSPTENQEPENNQESASTEGESENNEVSSEKGNLGTVIESIEENQTISSPINISGTTEAKRNELFVELRDSEHNSKVRGYAIVNENEDGLNTFNITLTFVFISTTDGYVAAYELDENGQEKNLTEIPVKFNVTQ